MADLKKFSQSDFDCQMKVRITPNVQNLFQMIIFWQNEHYLNGTWLGGNTGNLDAQAAYARFRVKHASWSGDV